MATRFYLSASGESTPISPNPTSSWEDVSILERVLCDTVKRNLAMTTVSFPDDGDATNKDILYRQYISRTLKNSQTITGSQPIKAQCRVNESAGTNNLFFTVGIRIIAADGQTQNKGIIPVTRDGVEATTLLTNRQFIATSTAGNYTTIPGDRIVIEIGMAGDPAIGATHESSMRLGDASASDLSEDDTSTTDNNPWVEFFDTLIFVIAEITDNINLSIRGKASINDNINLFIEGSSPSTPINDSCDLSIHGHKTVIYNVSKLYFADSANATLWKSDLDGTNSAIIATGPPAVDGDPRHLNADILNDKLHWVVLNNPPVHITRTYLDGTNHEDVVSESDILTGPGLKVLPFHDLMFWTDEDQGRISKSDFSGNNITIIYSSSGTSRPHAIDFDPVEEKIYFTDLKVFDYSIKRADSDGSNVEEIVSSFAYLATEPVSIVVDYVNRKVYWGLGFSDPAEPTIFRSNLDGTSVETIVPTGFYSVDSLAIDFINEKLYWSDKVLGQITVADLDGSNQQVLPAVSPPLGNEINPIAIYQRPYMNLFINGHETISDDCDLFIHGYQTFNENIDLFINGSQSFNNDIDLFVSGSQNAVLITNDIDLFVHGSISDTNDIDLYISGKESHTNDIDLYCSGKETFTEDLDLFINGHDSFTDDLDLFVSGIGYINNDITLFMKTSNTEMKSLDLFISGPILFSNDIDLFINGFVLVNNSIDLFIHGEESDNQNLDLTIFGSESFNESLDLFVYGQDIFNNNIDLFISGNESNNNDIDLVIFGPSFLSDSIDLFLKVKEANTLDLFIRGRFDGTPVSCPALDPTASIQITDELVGIYQSRIDSLINQLGKNVVLYFDPIIEPCPNCEFDTIKHRSTGIYKSGGPIPFLGGVKCPYCKGQGFLEIETNKCIKCLIQWRPTDAQNYGISVSDSFDVVRLKTFLTDADEIIRASYAIVNHDIESTIRLKVRLVRGPVIVGLRESRYAITFWRLMDS